MRDRKLLDKPKKRYIHNALIAAILNGTAAIFLSTKTVLNALVTKRKNNLRHATTEKSVKLLRYLSLISGRAPPIPNLFRNSQKQIGGKNNG